MTADHPLPRFAPDMPGVPRRRCTNLWHPAEKAIDDAMKAVEACGGSPRLTDAVRHLSAAHDALADHLEQEPRHE